MSEESTTPDLFELLRRADEAAERRDWDSVMSIVAPDAVWDQFGMHVFDGRAAIRGYFDDWVSAFEGRDGDGGSPRPRQRSSCCCRTCPETGVGHVREP